MGGESGQVVTLSVRVSMCMLGVWPLPTQADNATVKT